MEFQRDFNLRLTVNKPLEIAKGDYIHNVLELLKKLYTNKCCNSVVITEIISIKKISFPIIVEITQEAYGNIDICFSAKYIIYAKDNLIINTTIEKIVNSIMTLKDDVQTYIATYIEKFSSFLIDNKNYVPFKIDSVIYTNQCYPKICGKIFYYTPVLIKIPLTSEVKNDIKLYDELLNKINQYINNIKVSQNKILEFCNNEENIKIYNIMIKNIFAKYSESEKYFTDYEITYFPEIVDKDDLLKFYNSLRGKTVFIKPYTDINNNRIAIMVINQHFNNTPLATFFALSSLYGKQLEMLNIIINFINVFRTMDIIQTHESLWAFYNKVIV